MNPYHRLESPTRTPEIAELQVISGEFWGGPAGGSHMASVKAYKGPLPPGERGIEFTTMVPPLDIHATPVEAKWYYGDTPGGGDEGRVGRDSRQRPKGPVMDARPIELPLAEFLDGNDLTGQAILDASPNLLQARGFFLRGGCDDFDFYSGAAFHIARARDEVAVMRHRGHPDGAMTLHLREVIRDEAEIADICFPTLLELGISKNRVIWARWRGDGAIMKLASSA